MAKATSGSEAQFTYDFGIAIAQGTLRKITALTGVTLSLASAYYALKTTSDAYVNSLRENTFRFGGVLGTLKAIEQVQDRLIKGQNFFSVDDQLAGMNKLMATGINLKKDLDWISKAAHASGQSLASFSNAISSAIAGNMGQLVEMGFLTQRSTRMFEKYAANTIMRQQAILNFVKNHKGLQAAIRNDFETIQDHIKRIKETWNAFLRSVIGKPNDPNSFYGQIVSSMRLVADALARNLDKIKRVGYIIGSVLGWVIRQVGLFVVWLGSKVKETFSIFSSVTDSYVEFSRSLLVWLEFWKVKVVSFFKEYGGAIKTVLELLLAYKALKLAFVIGGAAIASVKAYCGLLRYAVFAQRALWKSRLTRQMGSGLVSYFTTSLESLALFVRTFNHSLGRALYGFSSKFVIQIMRLTPMLSKLGIAIKAIGATIAGISAATLWWAAAIVGVVAGVVALYNKFEVVRVIVNAYIHNVVNGLKFIWNLFMLTFVSVEIAVKKAWQLYKRYLNYVWTRIKFVYYSVVAFYKYIGQMIVKLWHLFMNSAVVKWIKEWIVEPLVTAFDYVCKAVSWIWDKLKKIGSWLSSFGEWFSNLNNKLADETTALADRHGVWAPAMATTTNAYAPDTTNYLEGIPVFSPSKPTPDDKTTIPSNPILDENSKFSAVGGGNTTNNNLSFSSGAIQIIVNKGDGIDERKLAMMVEDTIKDFSRGQNVRGGLI